MLFTTRRAFYAVRGIVSYGNVFPINIEICWIHVKLIFIYANFSRLGGCHVMTQAMIQLMLLLHNPDVKTLIFILN